jgi:hypothetical protein
MTEILAGVVLVALAAVTVYVVLEKAGAVEYLQLNATRIFGPFAALPSCVFCSLFWLCFLLSIPLAITSNLFYIASAIVSAPIARAIYENCRARQ